MKALKWMLLLSLMTAVSFLSFALFACGDDDDEEEDEEITTGLDVVEIVAHPGWHRAIAATTRLGMVLAGAVAGVYGVRLAALERPSWGGLLAAGAALGLGLPLVLRRRLPGELLVVVALLLALVLSFAIPAAKG